MTLQDILIEAGLPYEQILFRFSGNEELLRRFLLKFPKDQTFEELKKAVAGSDMLAVEQTAHTLKGLSANLGFEPLSQCCAEVVTAVRNGKPEQVPASFEAVCSAYESALRCIEKIG